MELIFIFIYLFELFLTASSDSLRFIINCSGVLILILLIFKPIFFLLLNDFNSKIVFLFFLLFKILAILFAFFCIYFTLKNSWVIISFDCFKEKFLLIDKIFSGFNEWKISFFVLFSLKAKKSSEPMFILSLKFIDFFPLKLFKNLDAWKYCWSRFSNNNNDVGFIPKKCLPKFFRNNLL